MLEDQDSRIGAERTRILYSNVPLAVSVAGAVLLSLITALVIYGHMPPWLAVTWTGWISACIAVLLALWARRRRDPAQAEHWKVWLDRFRLGCLMGGLACVIMAVVTPHPGGYAELLFSALIAAGSVAGALPFIGADVRAFAAYHVPTMTPYIVMPLLRHFPGGYGLAASTAVFVVAMAWMARRSQAQLAESLRIRFENLDLLEEVSRQKTLAEDANAAKSQLLAAASHDLRQPLHALSLFVGALKLRRMDGEARRLLEQAGQSVAAMDALFAALLDMTKLDAGVMKVELESFALRPLVERVSREFRAEAEAKGLSLRVRCGEAEVRSDPMLVERILRNLIANAVRYTDRGGVLVGGRRAGPRTVRLEVWDTGRGIAEDQHGRIFREFYQLPGQGRDRAQGLGLGLAIVQRMASLLDRPLSLASRPGRGSVFRIELPYASAPSDRSAAAREPVRPYANKGLILVLDDEPSVREAMQSLLAGWGHQVLAAASGPEMASRLDSDALEPELIICDWGLAEGETGLQAIRRLRAHIGAEVPAMLMTGDTRAARLAEAQAEGLLLLHKPVTNSRLRAAVGNLMRRTAG